MPVCDSVFSTKEKLVTSRENILESFTSCPLSPFDVGNWRLALECADLVAEVTCALPAAFWQHGSVIQGMNIDRGKVSKVCTPCEKVEVQH